MTFEERIRIAGGLVREFLGRFSPPREMSEDAQHATVKSITEAFVRKLPNVSEDAFRESIEKTFERVLDHHETYAWPKQSEFVQRMHFSGQAKAPETTRFDEVAHASRMIEQGKPVAAHWIWRDAKRLTPAAQAQLAAYRDEELRRYRDVYRKDAEAVLAGKHGDTVHEFLREKAA